MMRSFFQIWVVNNYPCPLFKIPLDDESWSFGQTIRDAQYIKTRCKDWRFIVNIIIVVVVQAN
jgi:hypothetical protein